MLTWLLLSSLLVTALAEQERYWNVTLEQGIVQGEKYWDGDYYEFYGIPYATAPTGKDRYKAPLPPNSWEGFIDGGEKNKYIMCKQLFSFEAEPDEGLVVGDDECLMANVLVPKKAKQGTKLPVMVYFHGGAYSLGYASMAGFQHLMKHEVIIVSFNFRIGPLGFLCLGTETIPGNAALKDSVQLLKWVKKNIGLFNGNPDDITLSGYTTGASMIEILMLSGVVDGLFNRVIMDSGSALTPWAVDLDPIKTAINVAESAGYTGGEDIKALTKFYLNESVPKLMAKSMNIWNPNSTFVFAPCVEKKLDKVESILTESPYQILKKGKYKRVPILTGFSNMEGISRTDKLEEWTKKMDEDFSEFLPAHIYIEKAEEKNEVIKKIKKFYFEGKSDAVANAQAYVDYFSDAMFVTSFIRSVRFHSGNSDKPVYLYEFSYVGHFSTKHYHHDKLNGASHRDQIAYILNFGVGISKKAEDLTTRNRLTAMWTNFAKFGKPIPEIDNLLFVNEWHAYTKENPNYMAINEELKLRQSPIEERIKFWDDLYSNYYKEPSAPKPEILNEKRKAKSKLETETIKPKVQGSDNTEETVVQNEKKINSKEETGTKKQEQCGAQKDAANEKEAQSERTINCKEETGTEKEEKCDAEKDAVDQNSKSCDSKAERETIAKESEKVKEEL